MSWFRSSFLLTKGLRIQVLDPQGQKRESKLVPAWGHFAISNLADRIRLSFLHWFSSRKISPDVEIHLSKNHFAISVPANCQIFSETKDSIWAGSSPNQSDSKDVHRARFDWPHIPKQLLIAFPNHQSLQISETNLEGFEFFQAYKPTAIAVALAGSFHLLALAFACASILNATMEKPPHFLQEIESVIPMNRPSASSTSGGPSMSAEERATAQKMAATQKLLNSLGVPGKPVASANKVLKPSAFDGAFSSKTNDSLNKDGWAEDFAMNGSGDGGTPLNLSDSQVAEIMKKVYGQLKECYDDVLIRDSSIKGKPSLSIHIAKQTGTVRSIELSNLNASSSSMSMLKSCFLKAYQGIRFPNPNQDFSVVHTLALTN